MVSLNYLKGVQNLQMGGSPPLVRSLGWLVISEQGQNIMFTPILSGNAIYSIYP